MDSFTVVTALIVVLALLIVGSYLWEWPRFKEHDDWTDTDEEIARVLREMRMRGRQ